MTTVTTPDIVFLTVPYLVTCSEVTIQWTYNATTPPTSDYPLVVTNIGLDQSGLNRRGYPLASRQRTTVVNTTLAAVNVSTGKFYWPKVNVPQGWYRMNIYAKAGVILSNPFNVTNGLDTSCVVAQPQPSIPASSSISPATPTSPDSLSSTNGLPVATKPSVVGNSSVRKGAIAGGVVGGVIFLLLIAAVVIWLHPRRKTRARKATPSRTKGRPFGGDHDPSDSTGAILPLGDQGFKGNPPRSWSEDFTSDKDKYAAVNHDTLPRLPSTAVAKSYSKSSTSGRRPTSMIVKPSFESYDSVQSRPSTAPSHSRPPPNRIRRTSRKPVPEYDPNEFSTPESNDIPLSGLSETTPGGIKTYHLIPDAPLWQRD